MKDHAELPAARKAVAEAQDGATNAGLEAEAAATSLLACSNAADRAIAAWPALEGDAKAIKTDATEAQSDADEAARRAREAVADAMAAAAALEGHAEAAATAAEAEAVVPGGLGMTLSYAIHDDEEHHDECDSGGHVVECGPVLY